MGAIASRQKSCFFTKFGEEARSRIIKNNAFSESWEKMRDRVSSEIVLFYKVGEETRSPFHKNSFLIR
jgi:hypothetical protein